MITASNSAEQRLVCVQGRGRFAAPFSWREGEDRNLVASGCGWRACRTKDETVGLSHGCRRSTILRGDRYHTIAGAEGAEIVVSITCRG